MKKAGIFAAVIALILLLMHLYNFKLIAYVGDDSQMVSGTDVAGVLKNGLEEGEDRDFSLLTYPSSTPLYSRGRQYYMGEDKDRMDRTYPLYVNEGGAILNMTDENRLINTEFETLPTYEWLYVSEGMSFNMDRERADGDEFIFTRLSNGILMNAQDMVISGGLGELTIGQNAMMSLSKDAVRYYELQTDGTMSYREFTALFGAEVTIGSVHCTYEELLSRLSQVEETLTGKEETPVQEETTVPETEPETLPAAQEESEQTGETEPAEPETTAEAELSSEDLAAQESGEHETTAAATHGSEEDTLGEAVTTTASERESRPYLDEEELPEYLPSRENSHHRGDSDGDGGDGDSGQDAGDEDSGGGQKGDDLWQPDGNDSDEYIDPDPNQPTQPGGESDDEGRPGSPAFKMPEVTWTEFEMGVYSISTDLTIKDPTNRLVKGVTLVVYREDGRAYMRRNVSSDGTVKLEPLPPDSYYYIEGYFDYTNREGGRSQYVFLPKTKLPNPTGKVEDLRAIDVTFLTSEQKYTNRMRVENLSMKDTIEYPDASPAVGEESPEKESTIPYVQSVYFQTEKQGLGDWGRRSLQMDAELVRNMKRGETVEFLSSAALDSNSVYEYEIVLHDRFGNQLKTNPSPLKGEVATSKDMPKATVIVDRNSTVEEQTITVNMVNEDNAAFTGDAPNPYLYVVTVRNQEVPVELQVKGSGETVRRIPVSGKDGGRTTITLTNLMAGEQYLIRVAGSFDLEDGEVYQDQLLGEATYTASRLSTLGNVNFYVRSSDVRSTGANLQVDVRSGVNSRLLAFLSSMEVTLSNNDGSGQEYYRLTLTKELLEQYTMDTGSVEIPADGTVVTAEGLSYPFRSTVTVTFPIPDPGYTAWDVLFQGGSLKISFADGNLISATNYLVSVRAYATQISGQSSTTEDVTGRYSTGTFRTLKLAPTVQIPSYFVSDSYADFYKVRIPDPDGTIIDGAISARLSLVTNGKVIDLQNLTVDGVNSSESLKFSNLQRGMAYRLEFYALEYNESFTSVGLETFHKIPILVGDTGTTVDSLTFTTGNSVWGTIELTRLSGSYAYEENNGTPAEGANLFKVKDVTLDQNVISSGETAANANWTASDYMEVEPGAAYLKAGNGSSTVYFYDSDRRLLRMESRSSSYWGIYRAPEGAAYARINATVSRLYQTVFMKMNTDPENNLVERGEITTGVYRANGAVVQNANYFTTGQIPVTPGKKYMALNRGTHVTEFATIGVTFFREDGSYLSQTSELDNANYRASSGTFTAPEGAAYAVFNGRTGYEDLIYVRQVPEAFFGDNMMEYVERENLITDGAYFSESQTKTENASYWYSDFIPVNSGSVYYKYTQASTVLMYDENYGYLGYLVADNTTFLTPSEAAFIRICGTQGYRSSALLRCYCPAQSVEQMAAELKVRVEDPNGVLSAEGGSCQVVLEYSADGGETWEEQDTYGLTVGSDGLTQDLAVTVNRDRSYRARLQAQTAQYEGRELELDSVSFETDKQRYVITNEATFRAIASDLFGDYLSITDVETTYQIGYTFFGHLDFQGHKIVRRNAHRMFLTIGEGAVLENLVLDFTVHTNSNSTYTGILCNHNYGTIRNMIMNLSMDNEADMNNFGALAQINYSSGVIENFAVNLEEDFTASRYAGVLVYSNQGLIQNGYVYGENVSVTEGRIAESAKDRNYRGGLVGANSRYGTVRQVYSLVNIEMNTDGGTGTNSAGTVIGYNTGTASNLFTTGHYLMSGAPSKNGGPAIGSNSGLGAAENVQYVQVETYDGDYYQNTYQSEARTETLSDETWYEYLINGDGQFQVDMVRSGYYPKVKMPDNMMNQQPTIPLPYMRTPIQPIPASASVVSQGESEAELILSFINPQKLYIDGIVISKQDFSGTTQLLTKAVDTEVLSQQMDEDGVYRVRVRVTNPIYFRSSYMVESFVMKANSASVNGTTVQDGQTTVAMEFYQSIYTLDDWRQYVKNDISGNYRIAADLDFSSISMANMRDIVISASSAKPFTGILDGGYTDADGQAARHRLTGLDVTGYGNLISHFGGTMRNLDVIGLTSTDQTLRNDTGFLGVAQNGAVLDNVHVVNARLTGGVYVGGLAGRFSYATVQNCSVTDSELTSYASGSPVMIGGLVGYGSYTEVSHSFVSGVTVDATQASVSARAGGFAGNLSYSYTHDCYAEGRLESNYDGTGGFVGYLDATGSGYLRSVWSRVNVVTGTGFAGGLVGRAYGGNVGNSLSVGDLFSRSSEAASVNRIMGYNGYTGDYQKFQNGAYAGQFYDGKVDANDLSDADWLAGRDELMTAAFYERQLGMSTENFDTGMVAQGYLPQLLAAAGSGKNGLEAGEPLPYQTEVQISDERFSVAFDGNIGVNSRANTEFGSLFPTTAYPFSGETVYQMTFRAQVGDYVIWKTELEGMELTETYTGAEGTKTTYTESRPQTGTIVRRYPFVRMTSPYDRYHLTLTLTPQDNIDANGQLIDEHLVEQVSASADFQIYTRISNAQEWNEVMAVQGDSFGNFEITGDIDGSTLPDGEKLITGVRVNRLYSSNAGGNAIKNIEVDTEEKNDALIQTALTEIRDLTFENITVTERQSSNTNVGVIGTSTAAVHDVTFRNITLDLSKAGSGGNGVGCIGEQNGSVYDVTVEDISINGNYNFTGGLAGRLRAGTMERITAKGSVDETTGEYGYRISGNSYVGGLVGMAQRDTAECYVNDFKIDTIKVTGAGNYVTGVVGYGDVNAKVKPETQSEIRNSVVIGTGTGSDARVAGVSGYYNVRYVDVIGCRIQSAGSQIGGVAALGTSQYCNVSDTVVTGRNEVGGHLGSGPVTYGTSVRNIVESTGNYAGGLSGVLGNCTENTVSSTLVKAGGSYAGGLGGRTGGGTTTRDTGVMNTRVEAGSGSGGLMGLIGAQTTIYNTRVVGSQILADRNTSGNSYAGGLAGESTAAGDVQRTYVDSTTTVDGAGNGVGGLAGYFAGGNIFDSYSGADINQNRGSESVGSYVGGLVGHLVSYSRMSADTVNATSADSLTAGSLSRRYTRIFKCYYSGNVTGQNYVGGVAGLYSRGDEAAGYDEMDGSRFSRLMISGNFTARNSSPVYLRYDANSISGSGAGTISYLRLGTDMTLNGVPVGQSIDAPDSLVLPGDAGGAVTQDYTGTLLVTPQQRSGQEVYTNTVAQGGLAWGTSVWDYSGGGDTIGYGLNVAPAVGDGSDSTSGTAKLVLQAQGLADGTYQVQVQGMSGAAVSTFALATPPVAQAQSSIAAPEMQADIATPPVATAGEQGDIPASTVATSEAQETAAIATPPVAAQAVQTFAAAADAGSDLYNGTVIFKNGAAEITINSSGLTAGSSYQLQAVLAGTSGGGAVTLAGQLESYPYGNAILDVTAVDSKTSDPITDTDGGILVCSQTPVVTVNYDGTSAVYQWFRSMTPGYNGTAMDGERAALKTARLDGRGYYYCRVTDGDTVMYTRLISVETPGYMPYLKYNSVLLPGQEGVNRTPLSGDDRVYLMQEPMTAADAPYTKTEAPEFMQYEVEDISMTDSWYEGGVEIELGAPRIETVDGIAGIMTLNLTELENGPQVKVYPSGAGQINIEFDETFGPEYYFVISSAEGDRLARVMNERVYTLNYDYRTSFTVTVGDYSGSIAYQIDPTAVCRTVMAWGDNYYYLSGGNIYDSQGLAFEGSYIHLFGGKALSADGTILDLESGETADEISAAGNAEVADTVAAVSDSDLLGGQRAVSMNWAQTTPLYSAEYDGKRIETYEGFSRIDSDEGQITQELKLMVKDGQLYALDTRAGKSGSFVIDQYQDQTFTAVLNQNGTLQSLADSLKIPDSLPLNDIAHTTNTMDTSQPWLLIRYAGGYAKGFNYVTGEELELNNEYSDMSLIQYVGTFLNRKLASLTESGNQDYVQLKQLKSQLTVTPLDESMLVDGDRTTVFGTNSEERETEAGMPGNETPKADAGAAAPTVTDETAEPDDTAADATTDTDGAAGTADAGNAADAMTGTDGAAGTAGTADSGSIGADSRGADAGADSRGTDAGATGESGFADSGSDPISGNGAETFSASDEGNALAGETVMAGNDDANDPEDNEPAAGGAHNGQAQYVYVYNSETGAYDLYKAETLLTQSGSQMMSETQKMEKLISMGIMANQGQLAVKAPVTKQTTYGYIMLTAAAASALILTGVMIYKRRQIFR